MAYAPNDVISTYSGNGPAGSGLDDYIKNMPANRSAFNAGQKSDISDFLGRYTGAVNNQESMSHMQDRIGREIGLPTLQENANMLNKTLNNIPYTYSSAAKGFDVNGNQLERTIANKTSEMTPLVTSANSAVENAQGIVKDRVAAAQADQQKALLPYQSEQSLLNDRLARESTGFNQDAEQTLNALLDKMDKGIALSTSEQDMANRLATAKLAYDQAIAVANINASASKYVADKNFEAVKTSWY